MIPAGFTIDYVSDPQYELLMMEVAFKGQRLFRANKETGDIELEFGLDPFVLATPVELRFKMEDLLAVIAYVRDELAKIQLDDQS